MTAEVSGGAECPTSWRGVLNVRGPRGTLALGDLAQLLHRSRRCEA